MPCHTTSFLTPCLDLRLEEGASCLRLSSTSARLATALLRCTASCALGRGPVCEGVAAGWRASHCRWTAFAPRACSRNWTRAPLCVVCTAGV
jgi:hypothetical protein